MLNENLIKRSDPVVDCGDEGSYLYNLDVAGRPVNWLYLVGLCVLWLLAFSFYAINKGRYDRIVFIQQLLILFFVLLLWVVRRIGSAKPHNWLGPDTIFVSMFTLFHFGYIAFYAFGAVPVDDEVFWAPEKLLRAVYYCISCQIAFMIGYELFTRNIKETDQNLNMLVKPSPSLIIVGKFMVIIAILFYWVSLFMIGIGAIFSDYSMLSHLHEYANTKFYYEALNIGPLCVAVYCTASLLVKRKPFAGVVFGSITVVFILMIALMGNRSGFVMFAVVPVLGFHYLYKKLKMKWIVLSVLALFFMMTAIGLARGSSILNVKQMSKEFAYQNEKSSLNPVTMAVIEFGSTIKVIDIAMDFIPEQYPYWFGESYIESSRRIVPNLIPGYVRLPKRIVGGWVTEKAFGRRTHGRGGSIAMEAYMNFGFAGGVITFVIFGAFYRRIYELFLVKPNFIRTVFLLGSLAAMSIFIRNTSNVFITPVVWSLIVPWLIYLFFNSQKNNTFSEQFTEA